ncbi:site-specific integrase [Thermosyntropha sp.]|uniref:site-specific integrase n=1 Tax=Thermosyntropha sp. TaxID=2740820 RepID=UPI0025D257E7|nr:site-specific integrase [Thermosyntropha sp.]MBO8158860.1 site-specific integrase [Thermosyntropha sp.]
MAVQKRGNSWRIVIDVGKTPEGKRIQKVFTFHGSKTEAKAEEVRLKALYKNNNLNVNKMTLEQYLLYWLDTYKKRKIAVRTYESYKETIKVHIAKDEIGQKPFDKITPDDIQKYYNRKLDQGLSSTSVLYHHRILHAAFNQAIKARLIPWGMNPCAAVEPPQKRNYKATTLSPEQVAYLLAHTKGHPMYIAIAIAAMTGARAGEVCGLKWDDIDFENKIICINKAVKRENGKLVLGTTKNKQERYVPLTPGLAKILKKHQEEQEIIKTGLGPGYKDQGFVLAWEDGRCFDPHYLSEKFTQIIKELNFPKVTFHGLRHFYGDAMQTAGANLKAISDALGHSQLNITADVYIRTKVDDQRKYVEWLDETVLKGF